MGVIFTVVIFILVLSVLVLIHELGHYWSARALGIRVKELGIGFPPRLVSVRRGDIDYSINLIPFGGFVKLDGEDDPTVPRGFAGKPIWARAIVIAAGSIMNLVLAWVIFSMLVALPFERPESGEIVVQEVAAGSPAALAGLQVNDVIDAVNGEPIRHFVDLEIAVDMSLGEEATLRVIRDTTPLAVTLVPRRNPPEGQGAMGVRIGLENIVYTTDQISIWRAPYDGLRMGFVVMGFVTDEVGQWFSGEAQPEIAGPVGIAQITGEAARMGLLPLIQLVALLSLNLGILNLLPIPALDGGRLPFLLLEAVRGGRRLAPQREGLIHLIGFAVLLTFILVVTIGIDIPRLLNGEEVIP